MFNVQNYGVWQMMFDLLTIVLDLLRRSIVILVSSFPFSFSPIEDKRQKGFVIYAKTKTSTKKKHISIISSYSVEFTKQPKASLLWYIWFYIGSYVYISFFLRIFTFNFFVSLIFGLNSSDLSYV